VAGAWRTVTCTRVAGPATYARHEIIVPELCAAAQTHMQLHVVRQPVMPFAERVERGEAVAAGRARVVHDVLFDGADRVWPRMCQCCLVRQTPNSM
jgi:hypothetical protein